MLAALVLHVHIRRAVLGRRGGSQWVLATNTKAVPAATTTGIIRILGNKQAAAWTQAQEDKEACSEVATFRAQEYKKARSALAAHRAHGAAMLWQQARKDATYQV
eukprot:364556-Chlamydomonas_euryale.AAC.29